MMLSLRPWRLAIPRVLLWCTSLRWFPPLIRVDSSLSVEFSPVLLPPPKRLESSVPTINPVRRTISMKRPSKELFSCKVELPNTFPMFLAVTLSVWSVSINSSWRLVPLLITPMLTPSDPWSTPSLLSSESPLTLRTLVISPSSSMVWRSSPSLIL